MREKLNFVGEFPSEQRSSFLLTIMYKISVKRNVRIWRVISEYNSNNAIVSNYAINYTRVHEIRIERTARFTSLDSHFCNRRVGLFKPVYFVVLSKQIENL